MSHCRWGISADPSVTTTDFDIESFLGLVGRASTARSGAVSPAVIVRTNIPLRMTGAAPNAPIGAPMYLWVPIESLDIAGASKWGLFKGSLRGLEKINKDRPGLVRTAALLCEEPDPRRRDLLMVLGCLMTLARQDPKARDALLPVTSACLAHLGARSPLEFWHNKMRHVLPAQPDGLAALIDDMDGLADGIGAWCADLSKSLVVTLALPVASERSYLPTLFAFRSAFGETTSDQNYADVRGTLEWSAISRDELTQLVWTVPRTVLEQRFAVSRISISDKCKGYSIPLPPPGFWSRKKAGRCTDEILIKADIDPSYGKIGKD
jgi:hypothetical protein